MIEHGIHIRREYTLIRIVHLYSGVGPPKEGLGQIGSIIHPTLNLQIGTTWTQCKASHTLLVEHAFHLVHPYRH